MTLFKTFLAAAVIFTAANTYADKQSLFLLPIEEQLYTTLRDNTVNKCSSRIYTTNQQLIGMTFDDELLIIKPINTYEIPFKLLHGTSIKKAEQHIFFSETSTGKAYITINPGTNAGSKTYSSTIDMTVITEPGNKKHEMGRINVLVSKTCSAEQ